MNTPHAHTPTDLLAALPRGLADATHDAQSVFRAVLEALSRPGRLQTLAASDGLQAPAPLSRGLTALLLTLLDTESSLHLCGPLASDAAWLYCRFHTGVQQAQATQADFVAVRAGDPFLDAAFDTLQLGTDDAPQRGATLIVDVPTLAVERRGGLRFTGPGIEHTQAVGACGLPPSFWQRRVAMQTSYPRGVDLLLVCGSQLIGVPRSTQIEMER